MPKPANVKSVAPQVQKTKLNLQIREVLGDAYSFVLGERFSAGVSSVTLEKLISERIDQIKGAKGKTAIRLNSRDKVEQIKDRVTQIVDQVKSLPAETFSTSTDDTTNVNVSLEDEE